MIQSTNDAKDINGEYPIDLAIVGDAKLVLRQVIDELKAQAGANGPAHANGTAAEIKAVKEEWLQQWSERLTSDQVPLNPIPRNMGPAANSRRGQHHRHPRFRQPSRPDGPLLADDQPPHLHRVGQLHPVGHRPRFGLGRTTGRPRQAVHQRHGRHRRGHGGHRLRDGSAREDPQHHRHPQQFRHGRLRKEHPP